VVLGPNSPSLRRHATVVLVALGDPSVVGSKRFEGRGVGMWKGQGNESRLRGDGGGGRGEGTRRMCRGDTDMYFGRRRGRHMVERGLFRA